MNPPEGYEHCNTPWMNMKVGDLVSVIWTEGCETPAIVGVVTGFRRSDPALLFDRDGSLGHMAHIEHASRQKVEVLNQGRTNWFEQGDLRVIA